MAASPTISDIARRIRAADLATDHSIRRAVSQGGTSDFADLLRALDAEKAELGIAQSELRALMGRPRASTEMGTRVTDLAQHPRSFSSTLAEGAGAFRRFGGPPVDDINRAYDGLSPEVREMMLRAEKPNRWPRGR